MKKYVVWHTPWPGRDKDGNEVSLNVEEKMLVEDAIKFERAALYKRGLSREIIDGIHEDILLASFKTIYWAWETEE